MNISEKFIRWWDEYISKIADLLASVNVIAVGFVFYLAVYVGYELTGDSHLTDSLPSLFYYLVVTGSTVGYGDASPVTELGQLFTAVFVIPFALGMFGLVAGKFIAKAASIWYRRMKGMHTVKLKDHIVLIGYNRERTPVLVRELALEESRKVVLISAEQMENPLPRLVEFINVPTFTSEAELERASIREASCIIVDTDTDENTLTISLFVSSLNKQAHLVAHFTDTVKGTILKQQYPNAEIIANLSTELLAKSVIDAGSSLVTHKLISSDHGQTQYSIRVDCASAFKIRDIFLDFKEKTDATIIGVRRNGIDDVKLNVCLDTEINPGDTLYYISAKRIQFSSWPTD